MFLGIQNCNILLNMNDRFWHKIVLFFFPVLCEYFCFFLLLFIWIFCVSFWFVWIQSEYKCCTACEDPISDRYLLEVSGHAWHGSCLRCCVCLATLDEQRTCYIRDDQIYCKEDYMKWVFQMPEKYRIKSNPSSMHDESLMHFMNFNGLGTFFHVCFLFLLICSERQIYTVRKMPTKNYIDRLDSSSKAVCFSFGMFFMRFLRSSAVNRRRVCSDSGPNFMPRTLFGNNWRRNNIKWWYVHTSFFFPYKL